MRYVLLCFVIVIGSRLFAQEPVAVLTSLSGDVRLYHGRESASRRAFVLDCLFAGDSLIAENGNATVFYQTGDIASLQDSSVYMYDTIPHTNKTAGLEEDVLMSLAPLFQIRDTTHTRDTTYAAYPQDDSLAYRMTIYVPGNTSLSHARPDVIWGQFPGANWYAVLFKRRGSIVINNATTDTVMPYTEQNNDLTPGNYSITVRAFHNKDTLYSRQCIVGIMDSVEKEIVKAKISALDNVAVDEYTRQLFKASVYEAHELYLRAAEYYETMKIARPGEPFVYRALVRIYQRLGLNKQTDEYVEQYQEIKKTFDE